MLCTIKDEEIALKLKLTLLSLLAFPQLAHAETDGFNMSLAGEFQKDYCELELYNEVNSLGISAQPLPGYLNPLQSDESVAVGLATYHLNCAFPGPDFYTATIENTEGSSDGVVSYPEDNYYMFQYVNYVYATNPEAVGTYGYWERAPMATIENLRGLTTTEIQVSTEVGAIDRNWQNLPDNYSHTFTIVVTIEPSI